MTIPKQRVLCMGAPSTPEALERLETLKDRFDMVIYQPVDRASTIQWMTDDTAANGGFVAILIFFSGLFQILPPNDEFFQPLVNAGLKLFGSPGAGTDKVNVPFFTKHGAFVANTPQSVAEPTAAHAMILILNTLRKTVAADRQVRRGDWAAGKITPQNRIMGVTQVGLRLGVLGMGSIGRILAKYMAGLGMKVSYYNRKKLPTELEGGATYVESMEELLKNSDVLSIHVPLSAATTHLIGAKEIAMMPDNSYIINTARGPVIDEAAMIEALKSGKLAGAGLDVFEQEPIVPQYLLEAENVVVTSHFAVNVPTVLRDFEVEHFDNLVSWADTGRPISTVNEPVLA